MIFSVQYMRAIAAMLVVLHHTAWKAEQYSTNPLDWFHVGSLGIDLFFIISGYIMSYTVEQKKVNFGTFIQARIRRIIPLYWVLTSLALIIFIIMPDKVNSSGGETNILLSYLLLPTPDSYLVKNGWTLSYEFYFYFIFALSLSLKTTYRFFLPIFIILTLLLIHLYLSPEKHLIRFLTAPLLIEFAFGIAVFQLLKRKSFGHSIGVSLIIISILLLIFINDYPLEGYPHAVFFAIPSLLFFTGMVILEPLFQKKQHNKLSKFFKIVGDSSYSLYLVHPFSLVASSIILSKVGIADFGYLFVGLLFVIALIVGHLCYVYLEKKLLKITHPSPVKREEQGD